MSVVYSRDGSIKARRARRAERCRYHVVSAYYGGVHRFKWVAIAHAWITDAFLGYYAKVIDTKEEEDD